MLAGGSSFGEIATALGLSRNTVRWFARAASAEELLVHDGTGRRPSILDEHAPYLHERWNSGCTNAALLWQEIRARGYQGSCRQVRGYLARFRESAAVLAPALAPPKARAVTARLSCFVIGPITIEWLLSLKCIWHLVGVPDSHDDRGNCLQAFSEDSDVIC